jgi:hypothetical protein
MALRINAITTNTLFGSNQYIDMFCAAGLFTFSDLYTLLLTVRKLSTSTRNDGPVCSIGTFTGTPKADYVSTGGSGATKYWNIWTNNNGSGSTTYWEHDITYHLALRRTTMNRVELYVDGVLSAWDTTAQTGSAVADTIRLHGSLYQGQNAGGNGLDTVFDSVRLYQGALSPAEIIAEMNSRQAVLQTNLLCDIVACAPGDISSYGGSKTVTKPSYNSLVLTLNSVQSYGDLNTGSTDPVIDFRGPDKLIIINGLSNSDMTVDAEYIYSRWKEWVADGNAQYQPAFRTIGGDPIGGGVEVGSYFFLRNDLGWRIQPKGHSHELTITGNLYPESDTTDMFNLVSSTGIPTPTLIKQQVSSLTQAIPTGAAALTTTQATQLEEIHKIHGLDPSAPLVVDQTSRVAGTSIEQTITKGPGPIGEEPITITRD